MKSYILLFLCSFVFTIGFAQPDLQEDECRGKCSHAHLASRPDQVDYYQYSSMDKYDVKYLKLNLAVEAGDLFVSGTALTRAIVLQALDSFNIELRSNMIVDSVFINGVKKVFQQASDHVFIPLSPALTAGSTVTALFFYGGTPNNGVYAGTTSTSGLTYTATLSESYQAREWFPVKQILRDKIDSADIWIKTSAFNKVGSNGRLVAVVDSPNSKKQYQWKSKHPMNYYMPSFAVGNYLQYVNYAKPLAMAPDSILVLHYLADDDTYFLSVKTNIDKTPAFIEKFSELFGLYPFADEKYGHSQANIGGGMEHQTMTTTSSFGSTLIAHELGHQWFGDNVTCATWNDIWLNEGFASYSEYLAIEKLPALFPTTNPASYMQGVHNNVLSQPGGSVYVPNASIFDENRIFSGRLSYNKGSAIIHNLRFEIQDDNLFFQTLKNYQQQFKDSVATVEDFKLVAETTSGKDFSDFFNQWYYGEGFPTFNVTYIKQGIDSIILVLNQTTSSAVTPFFKGLYEFTITSPLGDTTVKAYMTTNNQLFKFHFNNTANGIIVDPNNWVLNATGTITNGGVIPVKLLTFEVAADPKCNALVKWKSVNELDTRQYDLEYSLDGITFIKAGTVISNNLITESNYQFSYGLGSTTVHFFRLKMIDKDGGYSYSQVISLTKKCNGSFSLIINPNPVTENLHISINQPSMSNTTISIFASTGELIYKDDRLLTEGANYIKLDVMKKFSAGTYLIRVINGNSIINKKFIKL